MSNRILTQDQINSLYKNKNVARASEKSITYHKDFKLAAMRRYQEGLPPSAIFAEAGFNLALIGKKTPKRCLQRWRRVYDKKGVKGLQQERRGQNGGRPPNPVFKNEKEKLKYLEAQVAYLKAENAFLEKLRKQR